MKRAIVMILLGLAANAVAMHVHVRVMVQVIEVPHAELTKWSTGEKLGGAELHERAVKLALDGGAEILDTNVVIGRSGEKAVIESFAEVIYSTESDDGGPAIPVDPKQVPQPLRPYDFVSFETRNAGTTMEIYPAIGRDGFIDLRLAYEMVDRDSLVTWMEFRDEWGNSPVRRPIFETKRVGSAIAVVPGKFELFSVFTPKPAAVPAVVTRQLVFVRCDLLKSGTENEDE